MRRSLPLSLCFAVALACGTSVHAAPGDLAPDLAQKLVDWRRDLHAHPELGNQETRTAAKVAGHLRGLGLEPRHTKEADLARGISREATREPQTPPAARYESIAALSIQLGRIASITF